MMRRNNNNALTLIELLVVIFIIALLASAALTTYYVYSARTKFTATVSVLDGLKNEVLASYGATGSIPDSLHGISGSAGGTAGSYEINGISTHLFYDNGSTWTNQGAMIRLAIPANLGQGIRNFAPSTNGTDGMFNSIAIAFYEADNIIYIYCGRWDELNDIYIPIEYLSGECRNEDFQTIVTGN